MAAMDQYHSDLSTIENVIHHWNPIKKTVDMASVAKPKMPRSAKSKDTGALDTVGEVNMSKFNVWYVKASDPWLNTIHDSIVAAMRENSLAKSVLSSKPAPLPDLRPKLYTVFTPRNIQRQQRRFYGHVYQLWPITSKLETLTIDESIEVNDPSGQESRTGNRRISKKRRRKLSSRAEQRSTSKVENQSSITIESKDTSNTILSNTPLEGYTKSQWILQPNETQRFMVCFQPEETGLYDETYALTIVDGNNITYEVNITGIADIPRLDMNPNTIYTKTAAAKMNNTDGPTYYLDSGIYDFGSILVLGKDKRPHRRDAVLNFHNVSKVAAEVYFSLAGNSPGCFSFETKKLLIAVRYRCK